MANYKHTLYTGSISPVYFEHHSGLYEGDVNKYKPRAYHEFDYDTYLYDNEVVVGDVIGIDKYSVIIHVHGQRGIREGIVSIDEFSYNPNLRVGDKVEVFIQSLEDKRGQLVISHRIARALRSWDKLITAFNNREVIKGVVRFNTEHGMIVDVFDAEAFLPCNQISIKPILDYGLFDNKEINVRIISINPEDRTIYVSHKAIIEGIDDSVIIKEINELLKKMHEREEIKNQYINEWYDSYDKCLYDQEEKILNAEFTAPSRSAMIYTNGNISQCPYCGSHSIRTYIDGTALCEKCFSWFSY